MSDDMVRLECHLYGVEMAFETINGIEIEGKGMYDENCLFDFNVLYSLHIPHHHLNITGSHVLRNLFVLLLGIFYEHIT